MVVTLGILRMFFFILDETGVRFMPMKDRTWAPEGAAQVDISNMGDKRLFTCVLVVDATGNLFYTDHLAGKNRRQLSEGRYSSSAQGRFGTLAVRRTGAQRHHGAIG